MLACKELFCQLRGGVSVAFGENPKLVYGITTKANAKVVRIINGIEETRGCAPRLPDKENIPDPTTRDAMGGFE